MSTFHLTQWKSVYNNKTAAGANFSGAQVSTEPMERLRAKMLGLNLVLMESYREIAENVISPMLNDLNICQF